MKRPPRDPLILECLAALGAGRVTIGPIHDDGEFVHGLCEGADIRINPAIAVTDTFLHECLHRLRPAWSERTVKARTTRLMRQLSDAEIDKVYELVLSLAKLRKTPIPA